MAQVKEQQTVEEVEKEKNEAREKLAQEMAQHQAQKLLDEEKDAAEREEAQKKEKA